ncbi:hephaestin-like protein [Antedon mediterranea]|uniref:hephaestin-like protein n=1 Tax=Antedon mediterranea TaxID=105859 RepID=UPI003AF98D20
MGQRLIIKFFLISAFCIISILAKDRVYYVGSVEEYWDYAPLGINNITGKPFANGSIESFYLEPASNRIGRVYKKAVYREFTDETYETQIEPPPWLGFTGPVLRGEVDDVIVIHFKNLASEHSYTMHPHGVFYEKSSEGALYKDGTTGDDKKDDLVKPGETHTYRWEVHPRTGPTKDGSNCIPWVYHSHHESVSEEAAGLVGTIIACRKGTLSDDGHSRKDIDNEFVLLFTVTDENLSVYSEDNFNEFIKDDSMDQEDEDYVDSNMMDNINGYMYGNLPGLELCYGDTADWYIMVFGTEQDIHTLNFNGNFLEYKGRRVDGLGASPGSMVTATMYAANPGTWLVDSGVTRHYTAGSLALYTVSSECGTTEIDGELNDKVREYYISAEDVEWNYAPTGMDMFNGGDITDPNKDSAIFFNQSESRIGGTYIKTRYFGYTSERFDEKITRKPEEEHMGLLGPVIRAEVGETIRVIFKNMASQPLTIHPHGVFYDKNNEGQLYSSSENIECNYVTTNMTCNYTWTIPTFIAPTSLNEDCVTWMYYSAVDPRMDLFTGLVGPLVICKPGTLDSNGSKNTKVDYEYFLFFTTFDENLSYHIDENIATYCNGVDKEEDNFILSNQMASINGYSYANLPGLDVCVGGNVMWHLMGLGKETDENTVYFHGHTFLNEGTRSDTVVIFPGIQRTITMQTSEIGKWAIESQTYDHFTNGMEAIYNVSRCSGSSDTNEFSGIERLHYVAAIEVEWDYSEDMYDGIHDVPLTDPLSNGYVFVNRDNSFIGHKYKKAVFREFTDSTFTVEKLRGPDEDYLGMIGPLLRANVGDKFKILFKNLASYPRKYSFHAHGAAHNKTNEGSLYNDGINSKGDGILPGETYMYEWVVPATSGPSETDSSCVTWAYYSSVNPVRDINSGLIGPLIVCKPGTVNKDGFRTDVDREYAVLFTVLDENKSWYLDENINTYCFTPSSVDKADGVFEESNLMHGINGRLYGNLRGIEMVVGERVDWYIIGVGNEVDVHSVHFHGQTATFKHATEQNVDVFELYPGVFQTMEMLADDPGRWLLHCHVNDHLAAGMETTYIVYEKPTSPPVTTQKPIPIKEDDDNVGLIVAVSIVSVLLLVSVIINILLFRRTPTKEESVNYNNRGQTNNAYTMS